MKKCDIKRLFPTFDTFNDLYMNRSTLKLLGLSVLSATLFSVPWLLPYCGWLLLIAWIPIFWIEHDFTEQKAKGCWKYYALTFLLWNLFTTYWICKATLWGGVVAVIGNSFQMFLLFALFRWVKRKVGANIGYLFLTVLWITWEYFYFNVEASWPWLVLGNGFAETILLIQWYEYTGVLGGSLWVFLVNIVSFTWLKYRPETVASRRYLGALLLTLLTLPVGISLFRYYTYHETENPIEVVVLQPNIDPYQEKFRSGANYLTQEDQDNKLLGLATEAVTHATRYIFSPETVIEDVVENVIMQNASVGRVVQFLTLHPHVAFVVGAVSTYFYPSGETPPSETARRMPHGWYDRFNSAMQLTEGAPPYVYHKSKLVIGSEKMPFTKYLKFVSGWIIDLGGTMGGFGTQDEASLFPSPWNGEAIGTAVCYESVYGEYFASYVKKGAGFMSVITNDGWWGNTPGYKQHLSYSRLRAIETRRSIARSANTGISALINQRGDYIQKSEWWERAWLRGNLNINHHLTFYVRNGDFIGRGAVYLLVLLLIYWIVLSLGKRSFKIVK